MCSTYTPTLVYFNGKGRAEATRQMFALAGVKFEDKRYSFEEWGKLKASGNTGNFIILINFYRYNIYNTLYVYIYIYIVI